MKIKIVFVIFAIIVTVKGMFWAVAAEPVMQMLGLGSIFAAWNIAKNHKLYDDYVYKSEAEPAEEAEPTV